VRKWTHSPASAPSGPISQARPGQITSELPIIMPALSLESVSSAQDHDDSKDFHHEPAMSIP
jgi:hypothetical protein